MGLAFDSKYHLGIFVIALILYLIFSRGYRQLRVGPTLLCFFAAILGSAPVWIWNLQNHWASFAFQLQHGLGGTHWEPDWTLGYLGGELMVVFPPVAYLVYKTLREVRTNSLLIFLCFVPFGFFLLTSFKGVVELNWPITAYPATYALAVSVYPLPKRILKWGVWFWCLAALFVSIHVLFPFLEEPTDKLNEVHYFDPLRPYLNNYAPLYMGSYQMAATLSFETKKDFWKLYGISRHDFFDEERPGPAKESHFYLIKEPWVDLPSWMGQANLHGVKLKEISPKFELWEFTQQ